MAIQSLNSSIPSADHRSQAPLVLKRNEMGVSPLGSLGNLQYSVEQGGTPRGSVLVKLWTDIRLIGGSLAMCCTCPPEEVWTQRVARGRAYDTSCILGELLGSLTARRDDREGRARIVSLLTRLSWWSENDTSKLVGWRHSVSVYMRELSDADIRAMLNGVLGSQSAKLVVLNQISLSENDPSRQLASQLLGKIEKELYRRATGDTATIR